METKDLDTRTPYHFTHVNVTTCKRLARELDHVDHLRPCGTRWVRYWVDSESGRLRQTTYKVGKVIF